MSMVTAEFAVLMRVRACNMLLRPAKRTKFHASNMRTFIVWPGLYDGTLGSCIYWLKKLSLEQKPIATCIYARIFHPSGKVKVFARNFDGLLLS